MAKKEKKPKVATMTTKSGETLKVFEELGDFETFLRGEVEDNEFDHVHCKARYYPPFVLHQSHDDPEKIKDTENSHNKKFVRHLHQHVEKHLLKDIRELFGDPNLKFKSKSKDESFEKITWHYSDESELNDKRFKIDVDVTCTHDGALVDVDYRTQPLSTEPAL
ncbi:hypothetical protein RNJ44_00646 [Nakaseomyces bracarensis]|uniref:Respiratory growth induced protein 2 n=1 Tax=Nakaseomyces bracarensis TaxID=273131 RepID=A0ABR4NRP5_9SACH